MTGIRLQRETDHSSAGRYAVFLRYATKLLPRGNFHDPEDIVQQAICRALGATGKPWDDLDDPYILATIRNLVTDDQKRRHDFRRREQTDSLDWELPGTETLGDIIPARLNTEDDALANLALGGILGQAGRVGVRALLLSACGYSWETIQRQEGLARYSIYRYMLAARRDLKEMGYA